MTFQTAIIDLAAGPVDLVAVAELGVSSATEPARLFVQNVGDSVLRYSEQTAEPAITEAGHTMNPTDGLVLVLLSTEHGWLWTAAAAGKVAISPAPVD